MIPLKTFGARLPGSSVTTTTTRLGAALDGGDTTKVRKARPATGVTTLLRSGGQRIEDEDKILYIEQSSTGIIKIGQG